MTRRKDAAKPRVFVEASVNIESSNSPAKGLLTLFLDGWFDRSHVVMLIDAVQEDASVRTFGLNLSHLRFGNNQTFDTKQPNLWFDNLRYFLREGFWCTLEIHMKQLAMVQKTGLCRQARFIPLLHLGIPHALELGYNATLEIDNQGEEKSWSVPLPQLLLRKTEPVPTTEARRISVNITNRPREDS